jgi:hypothetical protein
LVLVDFAVVERLSLEQYIQPNTTTNDERDDG